MFTNTNTYNGWTNYATWRINLEVFDGLQASDLGADAESDSWSLGQTLKDYAEVAVCSTAEEGLALDYALAFMSDVNWSEIASHMISDEFQQE